MLKDGRKGRQIGLTRQLWAASFEQSRNAGRKRQKKAYKADGECQINKAGKIDLGR
jgi:hypothetical protein